MCEVRVGRDAKHVGVDGAEALKGVVVLDDLGRADKGEVHGVEEEDDPVEGNVLELAAREEGGGGEVGGRALDESGRHCDG
ncbi:hypothetical protein NM208_g15340 [Fusarium decemcellulare]|uniref:Uncharacterized protein n=1 Tax=Fusarium decemcellulare TaxID=57161 RepID=A0ACC1RDU9_9HYPO|nr:hypothetical protein NM208_g15340 [Fusarium decemcellulare]